MGRTQSYVLGHGAFESFLYSTNDWRNWLSAKEISEPHGFFICGNEYMYSRAQHTAADIVENDDTWQIVQEKFNALEYRTQDARIQPITVNKITKANIAREQKIKQV